MDEHFLSLLRKSFLRLIPVAEIAEKIFYEHLILLEPELKGNNAGDGLAAWRALAKLIECVPCKDQLARYAKRLGFLFASHGLKPTRYRSLEQALLWTARHLSHEAVDDTSVAAWRQFFAEVEHHMKVGAREHARIARQSKIHSGR